MKRYLVFTFDHYYPNGGWGDFAFDSDDLDTATVVAKSYKSDYWQVVDLTVLCVVAGGRCDP